jgi:type IV fimbrial biogenesis protein FimT
MKAQRGMTLVELMIAVLILSIVLAKGLPALLDYISNDRIRSAAEEFRSGLESARMEAIRRNTTVNFVPDATGWSVVLPGVGGAPDEVLIARAPKSNEAGLSAVPTLANVAFNGSGRLAVPGAFSVDITPSTSELCAADGGEARCLRVAVSPGGMVRMCDPAVPPDAPQGCQ